MITYMNNVLGKINGGGLTVACLLSILFGICSYKLASKGIDYAKEGLFKKGLWGYDLGKVPQPKIPEGLGIVVSLTFLLTAYTYAIVMETFVFNREYSTSVLYKASFLHFSAALNSMSCMSILGILDDLLDLPWRFKITVPLIPYIIAVLHYEGPTAIMIPHQLRAKLKEFMTSYLHCDPIGEFPIQKISMNFYENKVLKLPMICLRFYNHSTAVDFGWLFYLYGSLVYTFCVNSINIYAGINGLEVGQSIILCLGLFIHTCIRLYQTPNDEFLIWSFGLCIIFLCVSLPLYKRNRYPASVFSGNSFTTFSGVFFASLAFLGGHNRIILPLFLPQLINFILSLPQLLNIKACPRHRIPDTIVLNKEIFMISSKNGTLINLLLEITGALKESTLCIILLGIQLFWTLILLYWRHVVH